MLLLRTLAPCLLMAFLAQQVSLSSGARGKGRTHLPGASRAVSPRGKFSTKDKMQCTWETRDVRDTVQMSVKCENPVARVKDRVPKMRCDYNAKPQSCPGYQSDPKGFWKQVGRALKKIQGKVCKDDRALVKASMCKRAPRDAHFKLNITSSVVDGQSGSLETPPPPPRRASSAPPAGTTACTRSADHRQKAEEHCGNSWASVCSFFFSMLQGNDC